MPFSALCPAPDFRQFSTIMRRKGTLGKFVRERELMLGESGVECAGEKDIYSCVKLLSEIFIAVGEGSSRIYMLV